MSVIKESIVVMNFNENGVKIPIRITEDSNLEITIDRNKSHSSTMKINDEITEGDLSTIMDFQNYLRRKIVIIVGGVEYTLNDSKLESWNRNYHEDAIEVYGNSIYDSVKELFNSREELVPISNSLKDCTLIKTENNTVIGNSIFSGQQTLKVVYSMYVNESGLKLINIEGKLLGVTVSVEMPITLDDFKSRKALEDLMLGYIKIDLNTEVSVIDAELYETINMIKESIISLLHQQKLELKEVIKTN